MNGRLKVDGGCAIYLDESENLRAGEEYMSVYVSYHVLDRIYHSAIHIASLSVYLSVRSRVLPFHTSSNTTYPSISHASPSPSSLNTHPSVFHSFSSSPSSSLSSSSPSPLALPCLIHLFPLHLSQWRSCCRNLCKLWRNPSNSLNG